MLRVQRGPLRDNSWQIVRRYSDFANLDAQLKLSQVELPLPPKKVFGNFDRDFIAARQNGLQVKCANGNFEVGEGHLVPFFYSSWIINTSVIQ